jgi:TetR/AcrR family transcriptional regulator
MPTSRRKAPARLQGRPKGDRNNVGREALLEAACKYLATTSPSKINRLEIARAAGVDPGLIRYYFGNKDELITAAIEQIAREFRRVTVESLEASASKSPSHRLRAVVRALFDVMVMHPHYHQLIVDQVVNAKNPRTRSLRSGMTANFQRRLAELVAEGQAAGEFGPVDTRLLEIAMIGTCEFFSSAWPVIEEMFGSDLSRAEIIDRYGSFASEFVVKGIALAPVPRKGPRK